jgi:hypothetical protein
VNVTGRSVIDSPGAFSTSFRRDLSFARYARIEVTRLLLLMLREAKGG